jgi:uncharacterized protein with GYD domain
VAGLADGPVFMENRRSACQPEIFASAEEKGETVMTTFFMFGNYNTESIRDMSIERTNQVVSEIEKLGGKVLAMHALLGQFDLCFWVNLPTVEDAMKASVIITRLTGISFTTSPAVTVETFDRLVAEQTI